MRNPERIPIVLQKLGEIWMKNPDLRLGQLLSMVEPLWVPEDYILLYALADKFDMELDDSDFPEYWIEPNAFKQLIEDINSGKFRLVTKRRGDTK